MTESKADNRNKSTADDTGDAAEPQRMLRVVKKPGRTAGLHLSAHRGQPTTALCGEEVVPSSHQLIDWLFADAGAEVSYCEKCEKEAGIKEKQALKGP
jgi:hypothetical protein